MVGTHTWGVCDDGVLAGQVGGLGPDPEQGLVFSVQHLQSLSRVRGPVQLRV